MRGLERLNGGGRACSSLKVKMVVPIGEPPETSLELGKGVGWAVCGGVAFSDHLGSLLWQDLLSSVSRTIPSVGRCPFFPSLSPWIIYIVQLLSFPIIRVFSG